MKTHVKISQKTEPSKAEKGKQLQQKPVNSILQAYRRETLQQTDGEERKVVQPKPVNRTGLPDRLKNGIEGLSGYNMDGVSVHYNSGKPAQMHAHAYTQGTDIHVAPGQERHLPHEAWHVVQQMQGRVHPTRQLKGINVNDNEELEREATVMGERAIQLVSRGNGVDGKRNSSIQKKVIQCNAEKNLLIARLVDRYGILVNENVSLSLLKGIDSVLQGLNLPESVLRTLEIKQGKNGESSSNYDFNSNILTINNPVFFDSLYKKLNKESKLQRHFMDKGAASSSKKKIKYPGRDNAVKVVYNEKFDEEAGLESSARKVMGGVVELTSHENLFNWTLRHEIGHAADKQYKWKDDELSRKPMFGGWVESSFLEASKRLMDKVGLPASFYTGTNNVLSKVSPPSLINTDEGVQTLETSIDTQFPDLAIRRNQQFKEWIKTMRIAINHPWMFNDGCANNLEYDGRIYMKDEYGKWVSYIADARRYAVSNYQFAAAVEWFAEAFAAYFNPDPASPLRDKLSNEQKGWFSLLH